VDKTDRNMNSILLRKSQAINILAAILIAVVAIFPDVIRYFDDERPPDDFSKNKALEPVIRPPLHDWPGTKPLDPPYRQDFDSNPPASTENNLNSLLIDFLFFGILSWGLLLINGFDRFKQKYFVKTTVYRLVLFGITFVICFTAIGLYGIINPFTRFQIDPFLWHQNGFLLFKGLFVYVLVVLFSQIFVLNNRQQNILLENEKLKTESLQSRIEALTAQISPHFFFNSLNSLAGLVRDKKDKKALKYIYELSHLFRYVLQGKGQEMVYLKEELLFLETYRYLLEIRFENKITFEINVSTEQRSKSKLLALSLQPLIENITKHNLISEEYPMLVSIYVKNEDTLVVENNYQPKSDIGNTTGIGITNLSKRYKYLRASRINNFIQGNIYTVELPLAIVDS
jgi:hypothetical protein